LGAEGDTKELPLSFKDLDLEDSYSTDGGGFNPLRDFYIPVLREAVTYDRLAGFFSSTSLAIAARGVAGLLRNGGKMRLVCSPRLSEGDVDAIRRATSEEWQDWEPWEDVFCGALASSLHPDPVESQIARDHFTAVAWMLRTGRLEIRLSVPRASDGMPLSAQEIERDGIFHMKIGVLADGAGQGVSFSGSINESVSAWLKNAEEFKVFRSWVEPSRVADDMRIFQRHWSNKSTSWETIALPRAIEEQLWSYSTDDEEAALSSLERHSGPRRVFMPLQDDKDATGLELRWYQRQAVDAWLGRGRRGILAMATASGKTYAATACLSEIVDAGERLLAVIAVPESHLVSQWVRTLSTVFSRADILQMLGMARVRELADMVSGLSVGLRRLAIVVTTHATSSKPAFLHEINRASNCTLALIGDEAHGQGAPSHRAALDPIYSARVGLSATPIRKYDEEGSELLLEYYGGIAYDFDIEQALKTEDPATGQTILAPYCYHPIFVSMSEDELDEYLRLTRSLTRQLTRAGDARERADLLARIAALRASVTKKASGKLKALATLLDQLGSEVSHCFIYCQDEEQLESARGVVEERRLLWQEFTGEQGTTPDAEGLTERDRILRSFASGRTQVLLAMRCLDQGVDVPEARIGIMLASSQSEREFIQRRGRLLRRAQGKDHADIYDFIVAPSGDYEFDPDLRRAESRIYDVETKRAETFAAQATNRAECIAKIIGHRRPK
jgi:superfamily II DNA or RNA helicase